MFVWWIGDLWLKIIGFQEIYDSEVRDPDNLLMQLNIYEM